MFWFHRSIRCQFYNIYPAVEVPPNTFSLNSTSISIAAFLALSFSNGVIPVRRSSFDVVCIECQKEIINEDSDLLPDTKLEILYYDTSIFNTSKASIAALQYSLKSNHILSFGNNSSS